METPRPDPTSSPSKPFDMLKEFLHAQQQYRERGEAEPLRLVGFVLDLGYDSARIITCDPYKEAVGGIPKSSFLILAPEKVDGLPPHFSILRVRDAAPTPLTEQVQQTYFELHKKSMPELDYWTTSELQWGALNCDLLGMMYPDPEDESRIAFAGDHSNIRSPHHYLVYSPSDDLLDIIVNGLVPGRRDRSWTIGSLRQTESRFHTLVGGASARRRIDVRLASDDFIGTRTAMFGKTRLGKSNVVKLIAQGILTSPPDGVKVGQVVFDVNGEYANDNEQHDGGTSRSLHSAHADQCKVYALQPHAGTPSEELRINFYEAPDSLRVLGDFLKAGKRQADYITTFTSTQLPDPAQVAQLSHDEKARPAQKVLAYWAILHRARFRADEEKLRGYRLGTGTLGRFDPNFAESLRKQAYAEAEQDPLKRIDTLEDLAVELETVTRFDRDRGWKAKTASNKPRFDADDKALLEFLAPRRGRSGPKALDGFVDYHSPDADDFLGEIRREVWNGRTVILDLGSATETIRRYFADMIAQDLFTMQESAFARDLVNGHYVQLYFEEAHNLFPVDSRQDFTDVYARIAKEGAKFHVGMVYSTQSPSTINGELLTQTENFFVGHLSSARETRALSQLQIAFTGVEEDILRTKQAGYMRMLTRSHRFVIPVQARKFEA